jgi:osmotically-inducible protein OsmY
VPARIRRGMVAAAAIVATYGIVGCSTTLPRTQGERSADDAITAQVESKLLADPEIYARHIDVAVNRGVVHLGGFVWSHEDFLLARNDAASVPGVRSVDTEMELVRGGMSGTGR